MAKDKRTSGRMAPGPWDDKPGAGRIAPVRRFPAIERAMPSGGRAFWGGVWIGLSIGLTVGLGAGYALIFWCLSQLGG